MKTKPIHTHDCDKCKYVVTTSNGYGVLTDWYVCGLSDPTVIGRHSSRGSDYWSMSVSCLTSVVEHPALIADKQVFAYSEMQWIAWRVFSIWREEM